MATALEAYKLFLLKANKNDTNKNIVISKGEFVLIYNSQAPIWLDQKVESVLSSDRANDIEELLKTDIKLEKVEDTTLSSNFKLPADFSKYSRSYSIAKKKGCSNTILYNWDIKNKNINNLYIDNNEKPSFEYQETFVRMSDGLLKVHIDDFVIEEEYLDYYKLPSKIDIEGYIHTDGSESKNIDPIESDEIVNQIVSYCVMETVRVYEKSDEFTLAKDRIQIEK